MKKWIAEFLVLAMALSMAGCVKRTETPAVPATTEAVETVPETETAVPEKTTKAAVKKETQAQNSDDYMDIVDFDFSKLEPVTLTLADSAAKGAAGEEFDALIAENAAEITGGALTIRTYLNGEMGNDLDLVQRTTDGELDMFGSQVAPLVSLIPELAVFDLPMVFAKYDGESIDVVLNGESETRKALDQGYRDQGLVLLGLLQNATYRQTTADRDLPDLESYKGLKIRTMENENHVAFWRAVGADPKPMVWSDVYTALKKGKVSAEENAPDTIVGANLDRVQTTLACTNHILYCNQIAISEASYDALDPAYRAALRQAVDEAMWEMRDKLKDIDEQNREILRERGMNIIEYEDDFFDEIMDLDEVLALYSEIDDATCGLGTTLQEELK